mmetsp:Transcript_1707/g.2526  ORF Transcript_1707/g.2526 Transcript_1707/m.2526 type:complete len:644 (-) Transcript_1707:282-2213(-)|eukprot:CAMPEP_0194251262 /NCGR_PEP_ID=MMETSP0158-20130606/25040_1 /TAXON_ID=33649 /ORGANISM="Thalassionema nitzschioides, Strain L26-B" /LENGTH=643 /DNA_ID=CAMNT_0038988353 /DNA_START=15 /DNA_END=1946 /DNA_ORIENTATION=+
MARSATKSNRLKNGNIFALDEVDSSSSIANKSATKKVPPTLKYCIIVFVHILCLAVYLIPILTHPHDSVAAVLDEAHIISSENKDVAGTSTLEEVMTNDYWGRPMNGESSHKSWRPLTILSFRWLKTSWGGTCAFLTTHRIVNALAHAATGDAVSILAVKLFESSSSSTEWTLLLLQCLVKLLFCLHPTHVEVTANAANRPHLFAVLVAVVLCDPSLHILFVVVMQFVGLMCSETFIFQMPAVVITQTIIQFRNNAASHNNTKKIGEDNEGTDETESSFFSLLLSSLAKLFPRHLLLFVLSVSYLVMRYMLDWLSIPEGLIRPAENPFFHLKGLDRVRNYAYILTIHIFKGWNLDFIGFSHEYGFECIQQLAKWTDPRFGVVLFTLGMLVYAVRQCCLKEQGQARWNACFFLLFHLSWMLTLFPISGVVKVGTFIADRIVVASTVSICILVGRYFQQSIMPQGEKHARLLPSLFTLSLLSLMWYRVHIRSLQWMDNYPLLSSSLKTCPRSAKSHLEISKVYSGLMPELFDLDQSLHHLEQVQEIDSDFLYCDVHQQLAHVYIQQQRLLEFESELAKAILCPFTMGGATSMWQNYWSMVLRDPTTKKEAEVRKRKYELQISAAVQREQEELEKGKPQWKGARLQ